MRYSDNHKNFSCEKLLSHRITESHMEIDEDERESRCSSVRGMSIPMCTRGTSPPSSVYKKVVPDSDWDTSDGFKAITKAVYSYGTLPRSQASRSTELSNSSKDEKQRVIEILKVNPEDLASQITLMDIPIFRSISPEELTCCGWTKKEKLTLSPHVVEFTRRFNNVNFWVVREILNASNLKQRVELLSHFVKVARKLNEFNNFHSQFAIISALQSAAIYRLSKTWSTLSKKDRSSYEKMADLFSEHNNWEKLRLHVNSLKLPMIPYLGLFLTDIVYIDMAHPHFGGLESEQRQLKMNNILRVLADYQLSDYSHLKHNPTIQRYLSSIRYIEELQKFVEDDHYKLSLQLEPNTSTNSLNVSRDSVADESVLTNGSPAREGFNTPPDSAANYSCPTHGHQGIKFIPGHRKARSLGTNVFKGIPAISDGCGTWDSRRDSLSSISGVCGVFSRLQHHDPRCPSAQGSAGPRHLLDDSEIEPPLRPPCPPSDLSRTWSEISSDSDDVILELNSGECGIQGPLKRKTVLKDGKKPKVSAWHRYWVQLWGGALVYYHPKSLTTRGLERIDFKTSPCKLQPLNSSEGKLRIFEPLDSLTNGDTFQISDASSTNVYKFRAPSTSAAKSWLNSLNEMLSDAPMPENLISFD